MTQSFFVAEAQTGRKGIFVPRATVVEDVNSILSGELDNIYEEKFMYIGSISDIK